jgi:hypothetical protein
MIEKSISNLSDEIFASLLCGICHLNLDKPNVLPCGHYFCEYVKLFFTLNSFQSVILVGFVLRKKLVIDVNVRSARFQHESNI